MALVGGKIQIRTIYHLRKADRIKGLVFEGDGFCLVYKRLSTNSRFQWPRSEDELKEITPQQFKWLMEGLTIMPKKKIKELVTPPEYLL